MPRRGQVVQIRGGAEAEWFWNERIPKAAPAAEGGDNPPGFLCWGTAGSLPSGEVVVGDSFETVDCDETHIETTRKSEEIRIENPVDGEQYIMVDRANQMKFNKTETTKGGGSNTSTEADDFGDFSPSEIVRESFKPLGTGSEKKCRLTVTLNNTKRAA